MRFRRTARNALVRDRFRRSRACELRVDDDTNRSPGSSSQRMSGGYAQIDSGAVSCRVTSVATKPSPSRSRTVEHLPVVLRRWSGALPWGVFSRSGIVGARGAVHTSVFRVSDMAENRSKSARVRAICHRARRRPLRHCRHRGPCSDRPRGFHPWCSGVPVRSRRRSVRCDPRVIVTASLERCCKISSTWFRHFPPRITRGPKGTYPALSVVSGVGRGRAEHISRCRIRVQSPPYYELVSPAN